MSARTPVLILGTGLTALGALRAFGRVGIPARIVGQPPPFVRSSRWYRSGETSLPECGSENLASYLARLPLERGVLLPCSDEWMRRVAGLPEPLSERFPVSISRPEVLAVLLDKGRFARYLESRGLPHPSTCAVSRPSDLPTASASSSRRWFLKPRNSQRFFRRFGMKAVMLDGPDPRRKAQRFLNQDVGLLLQEYIPGPASNHYFVDGFIDADGSIRGLMVRKRLRMYSRDFGNSTYMMSTPVDEASEAVATTRTLLDGLKYRGVFSAEFKRDERDGVFRILEVNTRPWIFVEFAARCGLDVCTMAYRDALGRRVATVDTYETGRTLVHPYYDAHACLALYRRGELSPGRAVRSWMGADMPTVARDDPAPALWSGARLVAGFLERRIPGWARGRT